jgi:hypothetical protein
LAFGDQQYCFYPSHVPYDFVTELVNALLKTPDGYDKAVVRWNDEPDKHEFVFEPKGKQIDFRVYIINEITDKKDREQVFTFNGSRYDVIWPLEGFMRYGVETRQGRIRGAVAGPISRARDG